MGHGLCVVIGVGAQVRRTKIPSLIGGHLLFIDHKVAGTIQSKEATIAFVANKAWWSRTSFTPLVKADNVTTILDFDFFDPSKGAGSFAAGRALCFAKEHRAVQGWRQCVWRACLPSR